MLPLLVGGGFGPPLIGVIIGIGATRIGAVSPGRRGPSPELWGERGGGIVGAGVVGHLAVFAGMVLLAGLLGVESAGLVWGLTLISFAGIALSMVAARAQDRGEPERLRAGHGGQARAGRARPREGES